MASPKAIASVSSSPTAAGAFTDSNNNPVKNGFLLSTLNVASAELTGGGEILNFPPVKTTLDASGIPSAGQTIFANDQVNSPLGTAYKIDVYDASGNFVSTLGNVVLSGVAPIDLTVVVPTSTGASYPGAVLLNPSGQQTINGQDLVIEGAAIGFSAGGSTTGDVFLSRQASNILQIGTTDSNASATAKTNEFIAGSAGGGSSAGLQTVASTAAAIGLRDTSQGADVKQWDIVTTGGQILIRAVNDANNSTSNAFLANRSGSTVTSTALAAPLVVSSIQGPGFQQQIFNSSGTFTIPTGITQVKVTVVGSGGAGGGSDGTHTGTGGSSGGVGIKWLSSLTPGLTLSVTVGTGGTGVSAANGNPGNSSSVSSGTQSITTITTNGGGQGSAVTSAPSGGGTVAAAGTGGTINLAGNSADTIWAITAGGKGAGTPFFGGQTGAVVGSAGNNAVNPGAGGGGAQGTGPFAGGNGANGIVIFEWVS